MTDKLYLDPKGVYGNVEYVDRRIDVATFANAAERMEGMTDGSCLSLRQEQRQDELPIDLTTFSQWIEIQPPSTIVGILDILGNDLYRRLLPTAACTVKGVAKDLRSILRHLEEERRV